MTTGGLTTGGTTGGGTTGGGTTGGGTTGGGTTGGGTTGGGTTGGVGITGGVVGVTGVTGVTGVEYLVKAIDASGGKYSVATVLAVTDGTNADYTVYGTTQLGGYTGSLAVNIAGSFIRLQVTPASSNSTVWTIQYRVI